MHSEKRYINVFNKENKLIAQFSNSTFANTDDAKKNLIGSPTLHIVSNGESTLSFEMLSQSEKWQQIKDPENIYECGGRYFTALNKNSIVYSGKTVSVTLVETWYLLKKVFVQAHNVDKNVEAMDEHTVKILPKTDKAFKLTVNGVSYNDEDVKDSRGVLMPRGSAGYALWAILKGTDWELGVCDVLPDGFDAASDYGTFNVETDMKSVLENIQFIQSLYGGILDWDSKNKVLSLRDETKLSSEFNEWKGFEIRKGKNLAADPSVTWDNDIITRLYPLGNGNLNIRKVNGGKSYVDDFSYTSEVYEGYLQNPNIYDTGDESGQKTLKFWAEKKVKELSKPRKSIEYDVIDLRATQGHEFDFCDINDVVKAYYFDSVNGKEVSELLRVQEISYNYLFPSSDSTIVVGDKVANAVELFHQVYKKVDESAQTDQNGNISAEDVFVEIPDWMLPDFGYDSGFENLYGYGSGYTSIASITELHAYYEKKNKDDIVKTEAAVQVVADDLKAQVETFTSFQKETTDKFIQSDTRISQVSTELQAQITLEATHYKKTEEELVNTNARVDIVANDLSAQITLEASHYRESMDGISYSNARINAVANDLSAQISLEASHYRDTNGSIASLRSYADSTFATNSMLARYETKSEVNNKISQSEASIKQYASNNYASIDLQSTVNSVTSTLSIGSDTIYLNGPIGGSGNNREFFLLKPNYIQIFSNGSMDINSPTIHLKGKSIYWDNKGYLRGR